jgi:hypothetical protein
MKKLDQSVRRGGPSWLAPLLVSALFPVVGCSAAWDDRAANGNCKDWYAYDWDWHRCHWREPIIWCNEPSGIDYDAATIVVGDSGGSGGNASDSGLASGNGSSGSADGSSGSSSSTGAGLGDGGPGSAGGEGGTSGSESADASDGGSSNGSDGSGVIACDTSVTCPLGTSCVAGTCQTCSDAGCVCQRDDDCPSPQVCDHSSATCTSPPPACTTLTSEAACSARADCTPVYGGMNCTNSAGSTCHSGEADCTCATYSFAVCTPRSP